MATELKRETLLREEDRQPSQQKRQQHIATLYGLHNEGEQEDAVATINKASGLKLKIARPRHGEFITLFIEGTMEEGRETKDLLRKALEKRNRLPDNANLTIAG